MKTAFTGSIAAILLTTSAIAGEVCMHEDEMQSSLIDWYGETPVTVPSQGMTRLWVSDATGSWTLVRSHADGNACVAAKGRNWAAGMNADVVMAAIEAHIQG